MVRLAPWLLITAGLLLYANSLSNPFVFDDEGSIVNNRDIRRLWPPTWAYSSTEEHAPTNHRPVVSFTLALNYALGGLDVRGYRAVNIAVHALCALALFGVVRRTLPPSVGQNLALGTSLLWLVHPLNSQCINYVIQRSESLMALFYLLTLYCAIRGMQGSGGRWYGSSVACCALGMASKEVMVTAPLMVLLYDRTFAALSLRTALRERWPFYAGLGVTWSILITLGWSAPHRSTIGFGHGVSAWDYALNQCAIVPQYLLKTIWPDPLLIDYGFTRPLPPTEVIPQALLLVLLLSAALFALARARATGFAGFWFFLVLAPTSSIVPFISEVGAERRVYLALAGLSALAVCGGAAGLRQLCSRWKIARVDHLTTGLALVTMALLAATTVERNHDYSNPASLWENAVVTVPSNSRAHNNLGSYLYKAGDLERAEYHYLRALSLQPPYSLAYLNLGSIALAREHFTQAADYYRQFLELKPDVVDAHFNLGYVLQEQGDLEGAERHYRQTLALNADYPEAHLNLGLVRKEQGDWTEAEQHYRQALRLNANYPEAHIYLGNLFFQLDQFAVAESHYRQALELAPEQASTHNSLGSALALREQYDTAIYHFRQALLIRPDYAQARENLERALRLR